MKLKNIFNRDSTDVITRATVWFAIVTICNKGVSLATQPIINRLLTVEEVGVVSVYTTWSSVFSIIATFNLFCGVLEVLLTKNKQDTPQIVGSLTLLSILISIVFWGFLSIFIYSVSNILELKPIYIFIMAISITSRAIFQFWCVPKRFEYSYKVYSLVVVSMFLCQAVLTVLFSVVFSDDRVLGRILGLCIPEVAVAVVLLIKILYKTSLQCVLKYWNFALKFNIPLIPHYLSSLLLASSDKIMIQKISGEADVGLYSIAYSYANLGLIVFTALNNAYTPFAFRALKEKEYEPLRKKTNWLILVSILTASMMSLLAPEALLILGGTKYLEALNVIPSLIVGVFLSSFYFIFSNIEFVYEKNKYIFPITLLGVALNIVLNFIFIPLWGYEVAAYTTILGYFVIAMFHYCVSYRIVGMHIYDLKQILLYLSLLIIVCIVSPWLYGLQVIRYVLVVAVSIYVSIFLMKRKY